MVGERQTAMENVDVWSDLRPSVMRTQTCIRYRKSSVAHRPILLKVGKLVHYGSAEAAE